MGIVRAFYYLFLVCCLGYQSQELFGSIGTFDWWGALELDQLAVSRRGTLCGYAPKITFAHLPKKCNERTNSLCKREESKVELPYGICMFQSELMLRKC